MNKTAIIKYPAGNIQSVLHALDRLGTKAVWTDDPEEIRSASRVIFPGVGEASTAMSFLRNSGLDEVILSLQQPVLGICLGLQLFCKHSAENNTECLGIFDVQVQKFEANGQQKVPHMGWNTLESAQGPLFQGIAPEAYVYFVHSYYAVQSEYTCATTPYTLPFSSALQRDNFFAVQFHPEKSGKIGQQILHNFLTIN